MTWPACGSLMPKSSAIDRSSPMAANSVTPIANPPNARARIASAVRRGERGRRPAGTSVFNTAAGYAPTPDGGSRGGAHQASAHRHDDERREVHDDAVDGRREPHLLVTDHSESDEQRQCGVLDAEFDRNRDLLGPGESADPREESAEHEERDVEHD